MKWRDDAITRGFYPDFLVAREVGDRLVVDIIDPHNHDLRDALGKAQGLAQYAADFAEKGRPRRHRHDDRPPTTTPAPRTRRRPGSARGAAQQPRAGRALSPRGCVARAETWTSSTKLLAAAAAADGLHRIAFQDPIAAFGPDAIERLAPWLNDARLAAFAVVTIVAAAAFDATAEARRVLATVLPRLSGRVRDDVEAALRGLGSARSNARGRAVLGSPAAALIELRRLVVGWQAVGRPAQPAVDWQQAAWVAEFTDHAAALRRLPSRLDRAAVRSVAVHATESQTTAELAFLTSCGWGYGNRGYGWFRIGVAFGATDDPGARLLRAADALATLGAAAGYRELGGPSRLFNVGPAFGTKFLFFCQDPAQRPRALILDRNIADWHAGLDLDPLPWSPGTYETYLTHLHDWALPWMSPPPWSSSRCSARWPVLGASGGECHPSWHRRGPGCDRAPDTSPHRGRTGSPPTATGSRSTPATRGSTATSRCSGSNEVRPRPSAQMPAPAIWSARPGLRRPPLHDARRLTPRPLRPPPSRRWRPCPGDVVPLHRQVDPG